MATLLGELCKQIINQYVNAQNLHSTSLNLRNYEIDLEAGNGYPVRILMEKSMFDTFVNHDSLFSLVGALSKCQYILYF